MTRSGARRQRTRWHIVLTAVGTLLAGGCAGNGCSCLGPTPGGFPPEARTAGAVQLRVSQTGVAAIESDPAALVGAFLGTGQDVAIPVPASCSGSYQVCCPGGTAQQPCGPLAIDLVRQAGDTPRLEVNPVQGGQQVNVIVRARAHTASALPIDAYGISCDVTVDTTQGNQQDVTLTMNLGLDQDATAGTTRVDVLDSGFTGLETDDVDIGGGVACSIANWDPVKNYIIGQIQSQVTGLVQDSLGQALCKPCASGMVDECGAFADACTDNVCMEGDQCLQELGLAGRAPASMILGGISSGQLGAMDLYEVAGGYADSNQGGLSLGLLGGMLPAASDRDRCGPPADPPAPVTVPRSSFFSGNTRPDTGDPFDVGVGVHQSQIDQAAWAAYQSGTLCANIGTAAVPQLTTDALAPFIPSLSDLLHGRTSPLVIGLRPQAPPTIALGPNTFVDDPSSGERVVDQPLLDVTMTGAQIDVYAMVDDQYIRIMTIVTDIHLPIGVDVDGSGELLPVLGDVDMALGNLSVENSEALVESPDDLANILPALLGVALPVLGGSLGPIALPQIGPLSIQVLPGGITSVDQNAFLAVFGSVAVAGSSPVAAARTSRPARAETAATVAGVIAPALMGRDRAARPALELDLGGRPGRAGAPLEWSYRLDRGMWSPFTRSSRVTLARDALRLPGRHRLEVRAREVGRPLTVDATPVVLSPVLYQPGGAPAQATDAPGAPHQVIGFHGAASQGCNCDAGGGAGGGLAALVILALSLVGLGRRRRAPASATAAVLVFAALAGLVSGAGCGGGDKSSCAGGTCMDGEVQRGPTGRWSSIATDGARAVVAAYDDTLGDLVLFDLTSLHYVAVDGVPDDAQPTFDPSGYRGGVAEPGPNVGAYTSVALSSGRALISYYDLDNHALKLARETKDGWRVSVVDQDSAAGARVGLYSSLTVNADGIPAVAYMAVGMDDGNGGRLSELRYATATRTDPGGPDDWTVETLDQEPVSCAGLCGDDATCVSEPGAGGAAAVLRCVSAGACDPACADGQACDGGTCVAAVPDPPAYDLPGGLGLFASQVLLSDGRPAVVYYDRTLGDLLLQVKTGGWDRFSLDAGDGADTGMFADAMVDDAGTLHVAYQDAIGDQLLYTTWQDGTAGAVEVVDDGVRPGESRTHPVGASAALFLDKDGVPAIAYQDGATSDLVIARRTGGAWVRDDLPTPPALDGFYVSAAASEGRSVLASYQYDRTVFPPGALQIRVNP